jgi:hypothetical protein
MGMVKGLGDSVIAESETTVTWDAFNIALAVAGLKARDRDESTHAQLLL